MNRLSALRVLYFIFTLVVIGRLFYWQVLSTDKLQAVAETQRSSTVEIPSKRGRILAADGFPLVTNQPSYLLFAYLPALQENPVRVSDSIGPLIALTPKDLKATPSAELEKELITQSKNEVVAKLSAKDLAWVPLKRRLPEDKKQIIEAMQINGLGFESGQARLYPEASMAAKLTGFVGVDASGSQKGYFGLEGYYDLELKGKSGFIKQERDASGRPIVVGDYQGSGARDGRDLKTHIDRGLQLTIEKKLREAIEKYGAKSGEIAVINPQTGGIIALASLPGYEQEDYKNYENALYKIPTIADTYEPGSTFKAVVMAMGLEEGVVEPDTTCDSTCDGPVEIGQYTINTALREYHPGQTMTNTLELSDNTGMVFMAFKLGKEKFVEYLHRFRFDMPTGIDLEQETVPTLRKKWGDIDLATGSFGQGLTVTSIHMLQVIAAFANDGIMMKPHVVAEVLGETAQKVEPKEVARIISSETAKKITHMMTSAAQNGLPKWMLPEGYEVAGKTGTAQVPIAGHYDTSTTIHSYVGFAPAEKPRFAMIVKLQEPTYSPWASTTAAPLWMDIAGDLFIHFGIPPSITPTPSSEVTNY